MASEGRRIPNTMDPSSTSVSIGLMTLWKRRPSHATSTKATQSTTIVIRRMQRRSVSWGTIDHSTLASASPANRSRKGLRLRR
jgi:hypothetical protein